MFSPQWQGEGDGRRRTEIKKARSARRRARTVEMLNFVKVRGGGVDSAGSAWAACSARLQSGHRPTMMKLYPSAWMSGHWRIISSTGREGRARLMTFLHRRQYRCWWEGSSQSKRSASPGTPTRRSWPVSTSRFRLRYTVPRLRCGQLLRASW